MLRTLLDTDVTAKLARGKPPIFAKLTSFIAGSSPLGTNVYMFTIQIQTPWCVTRLTDGLRTVGDWVGVDARHRLQQELLRR